MEGRGRNPVSANIMDVTIRFFFNDVKTLFAQMGTLENATGAGNKSISYSDLIRYPPSLRKTRRSFRIRLVVGWSMNEANPLFEDSDFSAAIKSSKISVAADLYTHSMEFNQDGSLSLVARYKGALESAFSSQAANILYNGTTANQKDPDIVTIENMIAQKQRQFLQSVMNKRQQAWDKNLTAIEAATRELANIRKNIEDAQAKAKNKTFPAGTEAKLIASRLALQKAWSAENARNPKATPFKTLKSLASGTKAPSHLEQSALERKNASALARSRKKLDGETKNRKGSNKNARTKIRKLKQEIRRLKKNLAEYKKAMRGKHLFAYVEKMRTQNKIAWISTGRGTNFGNYEALVKLLDKEGGTGDVGSKQQKLEKKISGSKADQAKSKISKKKKDKNLSKRTKTTNGEANIWRFNVKRKYVVGDKMYFFRLGDLLTSILEHGDFAERLAEEAPNFRIMLGEYEIPSENGYTRVNLYDLPISLEIFHIFVAQKIVGTGRNVYPLLQFTFDLIKFVMDKTQNVFGKAADFSKYVFSPVSFKMDMTSVDLPKTF